ncbi:netrin receptor DSCAM-like protein [Leptotrombidium deliense]|uniref:Netrin receptor DSCAM-like protein n=1 Tax=Leptotrombidium deliense TaxID=299467 RepID=A0A443SRK8_9ACAR|nr:netrin receptor DSCAM-like protein [Leptotrombidium deliense]
MQSETNDEEKEKTNQCTITAIAMNEQTRITNVFTNNVQKINYLIFSCFIEESFVFAFRIDAFGEDVLYPKFSDEPANKVTFYNTTGAVIACSANGIPQPSISWITVHTIKHKVNPSMAQQHSFVHTYNKVNDVPGLRYQRPDGSLVFPPFSTDQYNEDIHSQTYRCLATNTYGTVVSRNVRVKAGKL